MLGNLNYTQGQTIFQKGDKSVSAYVILQGEVEIIREDGDKSIILAVLSTGEIFGEMGLVDERPRTLTARAVGDVVVQTVSRREFVELIKNNPDESLIYIRQLFERLRGTNSRAQNIEEATNIPEKEPAMGMELILYPYSKQASLFVPDSGIVIDNLPFRVGRESSHFGDEGLDLNNLYLQDKEPYSVSRNHFSIDFVNGEYFILDRGSYLGTIVNGVKIGRHRKTKIATLVEGDNEIIPGGRHSPFILKLTLKPMH